MSLPFSFMLLDVEYEVVGGASARVRRGTDPSRALVLSNVEWIRMAILDGERRDDGCLLPACRNEGRREDGFPIEYVGNDGGEEDGCQIISVGHDDSM